MRRALAALFALCVVTSVSAAPAAGTAPRRASKIVVSKSGHAMKLYDGEEMLVSYTVSIGPGGTGPKHREGDKVTPVGTYRILGKAPSKSFGTFMLIDYPNAEDRARFARLKATGALPKSATIGGDVGIHGGGPSYAPGDEVVDWTLGCVAVDDEQIKEVARMVSVGTPVVIED